MAAPKTKDAETAKRSKRGCAPAGPRHAERVIPSIRLRYGAGGGARGGPVRWSHE